MQNKTPAPRTLRDVFSLFRFYHGESGVGGVSKNIDWTGVFPYQIYHAVHSRPPDSIEAALAECDYSIADIFAAKLGSLEFRGGLVRGLLAAFPEKRRLLFVHIPKCAGANLSSHLINRQAALNTNILDQTITPDSRFFQAIKDIVLELAVSDTIYVHGHVHLQTYEDWGALRFGDDIFTVLREPKDQVLSQINYVLTRIYSTESPPSADTLGWRQEFDVTITDDRPSRTEILELMGRILRHGGVVAPNVMTHFLGGGEAELSLERLVTRNVEVTDLRHYAAWCRDRWGIDDLGHANASEKFVSWEDFSAANRAIIESITTEDSKLYQIVSGRLDSTGRSSLIGRDVLPPERIPRKNPDAENATQPVVENQSAAPAPTGLMLTFESIGENCEFGLAQRRAGAEPIGLLRFASAPLPKLMKALRAEFSGMGEPQNIRVELSGNGREYMIADEKYGFYSHAWVLAGEKTPEEIHQRETRRIPFLIRKLIEDLTSGEKIFVYHGMDPLSLPEARALAGALRTYGPSTLLWVERAQPGEAYGTVEWIEPGLLKGHIDRFAPGEDAHNFSFECWLELCRHARAAVDSVGK